MDQIDNSIKEIHYDGDTLSPETKTNFQMKMSELKYDIKKRIWPIRYFFKSISNIIRWVPILWKDRDWDHSFIYAILSFKLKNQSEYIRKVDAHTSSQYDSDKMMLCVRLIEKVKEESYVIEYLDYEKSNYNWKATPGKKDLMELEIEHVQENLQDFLDKHKSAYKRMWNDKMFYKGLFYKGIKNENDYDLHRKAMLLSDYNQFRAKKLLFKIMETYIDGWWD